MQTRICGSEKSGALHGTERQVSCNRSFAYPFDFLRVRNYAKAFGLYDNGSIDGYRYRYPGAFAKA